MHSGIGGMVRLEELDSGRINHALFMFADCTNGRFVYPGAGASVSCTDTSDASGAFPIGTRFQLDLTPAQIASIKESSGASIANWKKTFLVALAEYGAYVGDGGGGSWGLHIESGSSYTSFGVSDKWVPLAIANNWNPYNGLYYGNLKEGALPDGSLWTSHLRVIDPCVTQNNCL